MKTLSWQRVAVVGFMCATICVCVYLGRSDLAAVAGLVGTIGGGVMKSVLGE